MVNARSSWILMTFDLTSCFCTFTLTDIYCLRDIDLIAAAQRGAGQYLSRRTVRLVVACLFVLLV